jgi:hypothetical protein
MSATDRLTTRSGQGLMAAAARAAPEGQTARGAEQPPRPRPRRSTGSRAPRRTTATSTAPTPRPRTDVTEAHGERPAGDRRGDDVIGYHPVYMGLESAFVSSRQLRRLQKARVIVATSSLYGSAIVWGLAAGRTPDDAWALLGDE